MKAINQQFYPSCLKVMFLFVALIGVNLFSVGQIIYQHDFSTDATGLHPYTVSPSIIDSKISNSSWTNTTANWTSASGSSGNAIKLSNSSGTPKVRLQFTIAAGYEMRVNSFSFWAKRDSLGAKDWTMSINGIAAGSGSATTTGGNTGNIVPTFTVAAITNTVIIDISLNGATGYESFIIDDFTLNGEVTSYSCGQVLTEWTFENHSLYSGNELGYIQAAGEAQLNTKFNKFGVADGMTNHNETTGYLAGAWPNGGIGTSLDTHNYPPQGKRTKTAGIQINFNTTGQDNIILEFDMKSNDENSNTFVVQYTTNGTSWTEIKSYYIPPSGTNLWFYRRVDFTAIPAVNNNPLFAVRIVSSFKTPAKYYYGVVSNTIASYNGANANYLFDNIRFTQGSTIIAPQRFCVGESVQLSTSMPGGTWSSSNPAVISINALGQIVALNTGTATITYFHEFCGNRQTTITVFPSNTEWTGGFSNDWNNPQNWTHGLPAYCSNVTITVSGNEANYARIYTQAECNDILFEPETGVVGLEKLDYKRAFVQTVIQRDKWYNMTAPLKMMYSGDFYFNGSPVAYMKLFDIIHPDPYNPEYYEGTWTKSFASLVVPLLPGEGFAFMISPKEWDYPNGFNMVYEDKAIVFPRINIDSTLVTTYIPYSGLNGKPNPYKIVNVAKSDSAYRFAMEDGNGNLTNQSVTLSPGLNLIGNHMLTHLNLRSLYETEPNASIIDDVFRLWNGDRFITYSYALDEWSDPNYHGTQLAPMQSFVVDNTSGTTTQLTYDLYTNFGAKEEDAISFRKGIAKENTLYLEVNNSSKTSSTMLAYVLDAKNGMDKTDALKLFGQDTELKEVYSVIDNKALDINAFGNLPYIVPIGIKSTEADTLDLVFKQASSFDSNIDIFLLNMKNNERVNVKDVDSYTYIHDGIENEGVLYLEFSKASSNIHRVVDIDNVHVMLTYNNYIQVVSTADDPIQSVTVYDPYGRVLNKVEGINAPYCTVSANANQTFCVVKVSTASSTKTAKLILGK